MKKEKTERQLDLYDRFGKPGEWAAATVAGLTSGYITFRRLVKTKFHHDVLTKYATEINNLFADWQRQSLGLGPNEELPNTFKKLFENRAAASGSTLAPPGSSEIFTKPVAEFVRTVKDFVNEFGGQKTKFQTFADAYTENRVGISSSGIKGHFEGLKLRFLTFSKPERKTIAFKTLFAVGAGLGVTLMAFNQLNTRNKLHAIEKNAIDNNDQLHTANERIASLLDRIEEERAAKTAGGLGR